jgi:tetratricopeptide (TPR) repeat protein
MPPFTMAAILVAALISGTSVAEAPIPGAPVLTAPIAGAPAGSPPAVTGTVAAPGPAGATAPEAVVPPPAAPSRAFIEKLGAGDRAYLSGDYRSALFAYQDAAYLDSTSAVARVRLARAYLGLRHPEQAERQLKQVLELDPSNGEARRLLEELANAPPPTTAVAPAAAIVAAPRPAPQAPPTQMVFRFTEDAGTPPAPLAAPAGAAPAAGDQSEASRHYRSALAMIGERDFKGAIVELDRALEINPSLGVAVAARASALYGLGRYQEAVQDYQAALLVAPNLATPLYGLAESYRQLDDARAGQYYARYAESTASDVRPELRATARQRAEQLGAR